MEDTTTIEPQTDPQTSQQEDPPSKKLYEGLVSEKLYTKSYDDFQKQFNTPESISKLHDGLVQEKLYSKSSDDFNAQFFPTVKKKDNTISPSTSLDGTSQLPAKEDDPITASLKADELSKATKDATNPDPSGMGLTTTDKIPDAMANAQGKEIADKLTKQGYDPKQLANEFSDFPQEAFNLKNTSKENLLQLRKDNPIRYQNVLNDTKTVFNIAKNSDNHTANEFNHLNNIQYGSLDEYVKGKQRQQQIIDATLTGDDRDKAHQRLEENAAPIINAASPDLVNEYKASPLASLIDPNQYAGLKTLQVFEPDKYQQAIKILQSTKPAQYELSMSSPSFTHEGFQMGNATEKETDESINYKKGLETVKKNLAEIGRNNASTFANKKIYDLGKAYENAQAPEEKTAIQQEYLKNQGILNDVNLDRSKDDEKYPLSAQMKFDDQVKELTQTAGMNPLEYGIYHFGKGFEKSGNSINNVANSIFGSENDNAVNQAASLGESRTDASDAYLPSSLQGNQPSVTFQFPKEVKAERARILNDKNLSDTEKQQQLTSLVQDNQNKIQSITNPDAGKSANFFSKATLYGNAGVIGDLASIAAQSAGLGAAGAGKLLSASLPMFTATQDDFYKQAVEEGNPNPDAYANLHAMVMAAAGMINPDLNIVKRSLGLKSALGKAIAGVDEATWNSILNKNKPMLQKFINSAKSVGAEAGKMTAVYGAGTSIANDLVDKGLFDKNISSSDMMDHAVKSSLDMAKNSLLLLGVNAISNFKNVSSTQKAAVWENGAHPDIAVKQIDDEVNAGRLNAAKGEQYKTIVKNTAKLIEQVPTENAKGKPLTDNQRTDYLYNLVIKNKANELSKSLPEKQAEKTGHAALVADHKNNLISEPKTDNQLQTRKAQLEKILEPKKDTDGKIVELDDKTKKDSEAELEAVNDAIQKNKNENPTPADVVRNNADDVKVPAYKNVLKNGTDEDIHEVLKEVSDQYHDEGTKDAAVKNFGQPIVDEAVKMFRQEKQKSLNVEPKLAVEPPKPIGEMNSQELYDYSLEVRKALKAQDKEFEGKTEKEKEDGGYYDVIDNYSDLRDASQMVNFVENAEDKSALANSVKSAVLKMDKDNPSDETKAIFNAAKKRAAELGIEPPELIAEVLRKTAGDYKDKDDAEFMMQNALEKLMSKQEEVKQPQIENAETKNEVPDTEAQASVTDETVDKNIEPAEEGGDKKTGVKRSVTDEVRGQNNLPKVNLPKGVTDIENLNAAKERVDNGTSNPRDLVNRILTEKHGYKNGDEVFDMQYYAHQLNAKETQLREQLGNADTPEEKAAINGQLGQLSDEVDRQTEAAQIAGNQWHKVGMAMQPVIDTGFNISREKAFIKDAYGNEVPAAVTEKINAITKERDEAIAQRNKIEEQLKQKLAKETVEKIRKESAKANKRNETKETLKKEEQDLLDELKKSLKKDLGGLNAGIPIPKETLETLGKLAVNYFKQGVLTLDGLVDKIYENVKDHIDGISKKDVRDFIAQYEPLSITKEVDRLDKKATKIEGDITPTVLKTKNGKLEGVSEPTEFNKPTKVKLSFRNNTDWVKADQRVTNAEHQMNQLKRKAFESQKNWYQKGLMWFGRVMRLSVLSGVNVLNKLASAAVIGGAIKRIPEQAIGLVYQHAFKGISQKAPIEGAYNAKSEAQFYKEFFNPKKFVSNAWEILKTGSSHLTKKLGEDTHEHVPILYIPTDLHQIIKDPVKRGVFEVAFRNSMIWNEKNGLDINDPLVIQSAENAAYKRANREIFQESNWLSRKFTSYKTAMEANGNIGATGKLIADFLIPVSTVPTNIVRRLATSSPAGLIRGAVQVTDVYRKGIENLSNEQADKVMRQLKEGTLGTALWLIGWYGASHYGGLYSNFNPNKKRQEGELSSDEMEVNGVMLPKPIQHAIPLEIIQTAATARHVYDNYKAKGKSTPEALGIAGLASIGALLEQVPVVETPVHLVEATGSPYEEEKFKDDMKRRFVPQILKETGIIKDKAKEALSKGLSEDSKDFIKKRKIEVIKPEKTYIDAKGVKQTMNDEQYAKFVERINERNDVAINQLKSKGTSNSKNDDASVKAAFKQANSESEKLAKEEIFGTQIPLKKEPVSIKGYKPLPFQQNKK